MQKASVSSLLADLPNVDATEFRRPSLSTTE